MRSYCLAALMSSDRTKQICLWMTIEIYIYVCASACVCVIFLISIWKYREFALKILVLITVDKRWKESVRLLQIVYTLPFFLLWFTNKWISRQIFCLLNWSKQLNENKIPFRKLLRNKVYTIAFRFCWTIIRTMRGYICGVRYRWMYKKCKNIWTFGKVV